MRVGKSHVFLADSGPGYTEERHDITSRWLSGYIKSLNSPLPLPCTRGSGQSLHVLYCTPA